MWQLCIEGGGNYPRLPSLDRRTLIDTPMAASWNANIGFGDSCSDHQIVVDVRCVLLAWIHLCSKNLCLF
jgi:hypothetical protein